MTLLHEGLSLALIATGLFFFLAGSVGLLRFPDIYTRLHALTKADNVGLGCVVAGLMVTASFSLLDCALAICLPALAWVLLNSSDLFRSVVFYIVFGLVMALIWVRLSAVDVALVEAAVGAGLSGALFLGALRRLEKDGTERRFDATRKPSPEATTLRSRLAAAALSIAAGLFVLFVQARPGGQTPGEEK